jgi:hypothetical protein
MNLPQHWMKNLGKTVLTATATVAIVGFTAAPTLRANDAECQSRVNKADHKLHEAIEKHGYKSPQADHARHDLTEAREHCWTEYHKWWDSDSQSWRMDRDWHDDDHEHWEHH